jgi:hypothetical protein
MTLNTPSISFEKIHKYFKTSIPKFKLSLLQFSTFIQMNNQRLVSIGKPDNYYLKFNILGLKNCVIDMNQLANKLYFLKLKIELIEFNLTLPAYKRKIKILLKPKKNKQNILNNFLSSTNQTQVCTLLFNKLL